MCMYNAGRLKLAMAFMCFPGCWALVMHTQQQRAACSSSRVNKEVHGATLVRGMQYTYISGAMWSLQAT